MNFDICISTFDIPPIVTDCDLLNYLQLAAVSSRKQQPFGRDRLLVLAAAAACECGLLEVAERCRSLVQANNPQHLIARYDSVPDALRDDEFQPLLKHLRQLCPPEQAEFLVENQDEADRNQDDTEPTALRASRLLGIIEGEVSESP